MISFFFLFFASFVYAIYGPQVLSIPRSQSAILRYRLESKGDVTLTLSVQSSKGSTLEFKRPPKGLSVKPTSNGFLVAGQSSVISEALEHGILFTPAPCYPNKVVEKQNGCSSKEDVQVVATITSTASEKEQILTHVEITPENSPPTLYANATNVIQKDQATAIKGLDFSDADSDEVYLQIKIPLGKANLYLIPDHEIVDFRLEPGNEFDTWHISGTPRSISNILRRAVIRPVNSFSGLLPFSMEVEDSMNHWSNGPTHKVSQSVIFIVKNGQQKQI